MFWKKETKLSYDANKLKPIIHASICTGEKAAGFKDIETGRFEEVILIRSDKDLKTFFDLYGLNRDDVKTEY